ncbi:hypothetical protein HPB52_021239 [Rhipicephalus sanguineus]|uniref:HTH psq-type domain-containing protein n=1 Tax=Rhipicephalus sanguineus TaxID=34632 RepID=A0A9D4Q3P5_RHISA|nr:hypothetical protein HPB52_021239 [Rhipicephalus sanguineus]
MRAGRRANALTVPRDLRGTAPPPTPDTLKKRGREGSDCTPVARVAITAITTDRERFVGGVHFPMASVKKRKNLDFATKLKAIQRVEAGEKNSAAADNIGIPRSTLSTLLKNKTDIKAKAAEQQTPGACR